MKNFFLAFTLLLFPTLTFASGMTKQEACTYPDGIVREEVYVLWPGKIPYIEEFLKKDGFLYYFIHTFPDRDSHVAYKDAGNTSGSYIKNSGSYFVSFDCARSKVKFHTNIRTGAGTAYGKLNWIAGRYLDYSLVPTNRDPCQVGPDTILDLFTMKKLSLERLTGLPRTTKNICVGRSAYKHIENNTLQFDIEQHTWATRESFYSRYHYNIGTKKLKKIR